MAVVQERTFIDRVVGVAKLDTLTFEEIEHDESATARAAVIATLAGVSFGVGAALMGIALDEVDGVGTVIFFGITYAIFGMASLALFTTIAYLVGGSLLKAEATEVTWTQLFRTLGYAGIPIVAMGWMMVVHILLFYAALIWFLLAVVVAVRQALEFGTGRAIVTALVAFTGTVAALVALFLAAPPA